MAETYNCRQGFHDWRINDIKEKGYTIEGHPIVKKKEFCLLCGVKNIYYDLDLNKDFFSLLSNEIQTNKVG